MCFKIFNLRSRIKIDLLEWCMFLEGSTIASVVWSGVKSVELKSLQRA